MSGIADYSPPFESRAIPITLFFAFVVIFVKWQYGPLKEAPDKVAFDSEAAQPTRDVVQRMTEAGKDCVIFYGSQSGNAEDYAARLAQEGKARYGLETMVADLEDYDYDSLNSIPQDKVVMFVLATYGEGEPTDNAVDFYTFITDVDSNESLEGLRYTIFGLGNSTYEHYNLMGRSVDKALQRLGAQRIGDAGEGNDGTGTLEEDFLSWKDTMWAAVSKEMGLHQLEVTYEPVYRIIRRDSLCSSSPSVYVGQPNKLHLDGLTQGPYNAHNPYIASVTESRELFTTGTRSCLHLEVDINLSGLTYQTGDHIAVWPVNPGHEVDRLLRVFGLEDDKNTVIDVEAFESTTKVPFPTPTTFDAIVRHQLEICAPVSRQLLETLAGFAPTDAAKAKTTALATDKTRFHDTVSKMQYSIARTLEILSDGEPWTGVSFSAIIEGLTKLQPRYYSISSSSLVQPQRVSITVAVEDQAITGRSDRFRGVASNYLLALKHIQNREVDGEPAYEIGGPGGTPVILVGPGTGIAPMRGFVMERAKQAQLGRSVGKTLVFFGCRRVDEDYIYASEWSDYKKALGDGFEIITAFSRDGPSKVYVQHRLKEHASEVNKLMKEKASVYVCGDANRMARDTRHTLVQIISQQRGVSETAAEGVLKSMRATARYQV
ncbi:hypothetical protein ACHAPJ_008972 [Fusarium lateritium]